MKYQDPENEILRRRRRDNIPNSTESQSAITSYSISTPKMSVSTTTGGTPISKSQSDYHFPHSSKLTSQEKNIDHLDDQIRRSSSFDFNTVNKQSIIDSAAGVPVLSHYSGILTAKLKLPMQLNVQEGQSTLNLAGELLDIPFIEDSSFDNAASDDLSSKLLFIK